MPTDCIFCKIVSGSIPANRIYEDELCIGFPDIHPQAPTHLLIIPKEHITSQAKAVAAHKPLLGHLMSVAADLARSQKLDRGYRVVVNTGDDGGQDRKSTRLNSSHERRSRMPSSA